MESKDEQLILTPDEARKILRCSRSVIYSGIKNGSIPSIRISARKIVIPRHAFFAWLNSAGGDGATPQ